MKTSELSLCTKLLYIFKVLTAKVCLKTFLDQRHKNGMCLSLKMNPKKLLNNLLIID